jgi:hypothetical protein
MVHMLDLPVSEKNLEAVGEQVRIEFFHTSAREISQMVLAMIEEILLKGHPLTFFRSEARI